MIYKKLGNSDISISSLGLGTGTGFNCIDTKRDKDLIFILQKAIDLGINFIDTAESYFNGHAEKIIGKALRNRRSKAIVATKFSPENSSLQDVLKAAKKSLKRLNSDYIDLYQIHWPSPNIPIEETMSALTKLQKNGLIRYIGLSNFSLTQIKKVSPNPKFSIISIQSEYNLLERTVEQDIIPYCQNNQLTFIAYTPLSSGRFLRKNLNQKIQRLPKKYNKTFSQIILNWITSQKNIIAIPATTNPGHLQENSESCDFVLDKKDFDLISNTFKQKIIKVPTYKISVLKSNNHSAYTSIREAFENKLGFSPSPLELAKELKSGELLKPIKLVRVAKENTGFSFELTGGQIRYWAWVIAFDGKKPIPATVESPDEIL